MVWAKPFFSTAPMRKVRIVYWKTHIRFLIFPIHKLFWNHRRPLDALEPDVRISRDGTGKPVQPERRTKTGFTNLIARCSDDRKSKHTTKFRADMNATHSLIANLPLSCENRSAQSSRQLRHSIYPDGSFRKTNTALHSRRSRLEEINSRTREYYQLHLSPSTRGTAPMHH
jgi:hypothetical protein